MGLFDKAKDAVNKNEDKVDAGIDKASDQVNQRTDGKYEDKVEQGADQLKDRTGNL